MLCKTFNYIKAHGGNSTQNVTNIKGRLVTSEDKKMSAFCSPAVRALKALKETDCDEVLYKNNEEDY